MGVSNTEILPDPIQSFTAGLAAARREPNRLRGGLRPRLRDANRTKGRGHAIAEARPATPCRVRRAAADATPGANPVDK